jgi:hypothetical protein
MVIILRPAPGATARSLGGFLDGVHVDVGEAPPALFCFGGLEFRASGRCERLQDDTVACVYEVAPEPLTG